MGGGAESKATIPQFLHRCASLTLSYDRCQPEEAVARFACMFSMKIAFMEIASKGRQVNSLSTIIRPCPDVECGANRHIGRSCFAIADRCIVVNHVHLLMKHRSCLRSLLSVGE